MSAAPAAWHPDPTGRHQLRYWDGAEWSAHVSDDGIRGTDVLDGGTGQVRQRGLDRVDQVFTVGNEGDPDKIHQQLHGDGRYRSAKVGDVAFQGGGSVFTEPILVVNQKAKLLELKNEFSVYDRNGAKIAAVDEIGQSKARKALRLVSNLDQYMTHKLEITDASGQVMLRITRPRKLFKSSVIVTDANDVAIGSIVQDNVFGKIHFSLQVGSETVGAIKAENWRAWNFRIEDHTGTEIARITKTFEGVLKSAFTTADNYVVQIHTHIPQPLNSLVVAAALCVDTALKQDSR